ncbi:MAG: sigma-54 dependent transcriptional regulator [bacterium]
MNRILIVDNDEGLVHFLCRILRKQGHEVSEARDGNAALARIRSEAFDLILLDYKMPGLNGLETLREIRRSSNRTPVIIMTAYGTTDTAISAMKLGAYDYLLKPFETEELSRIVADALEVNRLMKEIVSLPPEFAPLISSPSGDVVEMVGSSKGMQEVFKTVGQVAEQDVTVLITGESGTGKELVARAIYHHSRRHDRPFLAVNCAAIPDTLFESELFGYERGAFTGANRTYLGKFERVDGGTLFFDEVGDLSLSTQAKLLRVLQQGEFERLGGDHTLRADVRVIAATNKDLQAEVEQNRFRRDLYWRLNVISISLPPLRERGDDLVLLAHHFVNLFARKHGKTIRFISNSALEKIREYPWPGNVRELENCFQRAVLLCAGEVLLDDHVRLECDWRSGPVPALNWEERLKDQLEQIIDEIIAGPQDFSQANVLEVVEKVLIANVLQKCDYNQVKASKMLGISRNTLRQRMKAYRIHSPDPS